MRSCKTKIKRIGFGFIAVCFWLLIWQLLAAKINSRIFLPAPADTFHSLTILSKKEEFWQTIFNSFTRIVEGFMLAVVCGFILAVLSAFCKFVRMLLSPLMKLIKAVPVASFIILALLWIDSENLSVLISFIMVLPVIYINVIQAFCHVDKNMLEMAKVFRVPVRRRLRFIYMPAVLPAFIAACKIGLGFCFKSGIAAEIIGLPGKSIGTELYKAKLYLMTDELFAWTIVIILMSVFFEGICIYILNKFMILVKNVHRVPVNEKQHQNTENKRGESAAKITDGGSFEVELEGICKSFGKQKVLENVYLKVRSGKPKCIMGVSGIGKTTLLKIMSGVMKPDSGQVIIPDGKRISAVFQEDRLIEEADVYTNLYCVMGNAFDRDLVDKHLKMTGLEGIGNKPVNELSGGMKRRIALIRAVLADSEIIVLDEAFKGLDNENRDIALQYIKICCKDKVILLISHDRAEGNRIGAEIIDLDDINEVKTNESK